MNAARISFRKMVIAAALVALASFLAICVVRATAAPRTNGFATSLTSGAPSGPAHAFVASESPPDALAFRPSVPGSSPRPVIAHYFPPYPLTIGGRDPENDYYAKHYLRRDGENGKFAAWGGLLRQRPLPGPRAKAQRQADLRVEVARAAGIGIDVFGVDLLKLDGRVAEVVPNLLEAAQETDPRFRIAIQPDMTSLRTVTLDELVAYLLNFAKHPAAFRAADGRLVVMPFRTEARPPEFWQALVDRMAQAGEPVAFIPYFVDPAKARGYAGFSAAATRGITADATGGLAQRAFGLKASTQGYSAWIANAAPQDVRAKYGVAYEAEGSRSFTEAIRAGIDGGASALHFMTWNDYSEATEIQPSTATRFAYYDIAAYHIAWFKTGAPPIIERDGFVGLHRRQLFRPANRALGKPWRVRGGPALDIVEMTAFLTAPAAIGPVSMSIARRGRTLAACKSPWTIEAQPDRQDPLYAGFSSLRGCR
jgi:hypothetical protein